MRNLQSIKISGHSIVASNIAQSFSAEQVGELHVQNTAIDQLKQSAQFALLQSIEQRNSTVSDLSENFLSTINSISDLVKNGTWQVLLIIACIVLLFCLVYFMRSNSSPSVIAAKQTNDQQKPTTNQNQRP